jgi:hypothetical protein
MLQQRTGWQAAATAVAGAAGQRRCSGTGVGDSHPQGRQDRSAKAAAGRPCRQGRTIACCAEIGSAAAALCISDRSAGCGMQLVLWVQVAVDVDAVKWSLCHDRTPFFASALSGLKLAMTRNEDNSGEKRRCLPCFVGTKLCDLLDCPHFAPAFIAARRFRVLIHDSPHHVPMPDALGCANARVEQVPDLPHRHRGAGRARRS